MFYLHSNSTDKQIIRVIISNFLTQNLLRISLDLIITFVCNDSGPLTIIQIYVTFDVSLHLNFYQSSEKLDWDPCYYKRSDCADYTPVARLINISYQNRNVIIRPLESLLLPPFVSNRSRSIQFARNLVRAQRNSKRFESRERIHPHEWFPRWGKIVNIICNQLISRRWGQLLFPFRTV